MTAIPRTFTAAVTRDGNWYVARCLEVEVTSQGKSVDEAVNNLREALELYFEDVPVPAADDRTLVTHVDICVPA